MDQGEDSGNDSWSLNSISEADERSGSASGGTDSLLDQNNDSLTKRKLAISLLRLNTRRSQYDKMMLQAITEEKIVVMDKREVDHTVQPAIDQMSEAIKNFVED